MEVREAEATNFHEEVEQRGRQPVLGLGSHLNMENLIQDKVTETDLHAHIIGLPSQRVEEEQLWKAPRLPPRGKRKV
jgi:hypothetical protein